MTRINRRRYCRFVGRRRSREPAGWQGFWRPAARPLLPGTTLHWVRGSDYVPVSDQKLRTKILEQAKRISASNSISKPSTG